MTPRFTASAYVRIPYRERKDEKKQLKQLGYDCSMYDNHEDEFMFINKGVMGCVFLPTFIENSFIDCGTDINLFLELAQMRSDTDKGQWFTNGRDWYRHVGEDGQFKEIKHLSTCHRATPQEVYEHLKKK